MPKGGPEHIPDWGRQERERDLGWIHENVHGLWPAAQVGFELAGRGAIVTDTTTIVQSEVGQHNAFAYLPAKDVNEHLSPDAYGMVARYDPRSEFVTVLLKPQNRESAYRIRVLPQSIQN